MVGWFLFLHIQRRKDFILFYLLLIIILSYLLFPRLPQTHYVAEVGHEFLSTGWEKETNYKCGQHHPLGLGPGLNQKGIKEKKADGHQTSTIVLTCANVSWQSRASGTTVTSQAHCQPSPLWWTVSPELWAETTLSSWRWFLSGIWSEQW